VSIFGCPAIIRFGCLQRTPISLWPLSYRLDGDLPLRIAGALRLHRLITAKNAGPIPQSQALTAQQRKRLIQMLLALDGHFSQASYREIASALFDPSVTTEKGWKTHPIRARTIRLVNDAIKMVNLGYLKLLRARRPQ
jgi:hypothetical protein